ncbi:MAG: hypothetical protein ABI992_08110, partial [Chthoniobacterales bacterium]
RAFPMQRNRAAFDLIPLPHPSGASPWHRIPPGKALLGKAMRLIARHPAMKPALRGAIAEGQNDPSKRIENVSSSERLKL